MSRASNVDAALDDILAGASQGAGGPRPSGQGSNQSTAVATRTKNILAGPDPEVTVDAVLRLVDGLPDFEEVAEVGDEDVSALTDLEEQQKQQTEGVIRTALAAGDAAVYVIAQGLELAKKGKWHRRTHRTFGDYVQWLTGRSAVYQRQLRQAAPLALETGQRTGVVPNPGQAKELVRTEKAFGRDTAVTVFEVIREHSAILGERPTAAALRAAHEALPVTLPDAPELKRDVIEVAARQALGLDVDEAEAEVPSKPEPEPEPELLAGAAIAAPTFEGKSNSGAAIAAPPSAPIVSPAPGQPGPESDAEDTAPPATTADTPDADAEGSGGGDTDGIPDAEVVPDELVALQYALKLLKDADRTATKAVFAQAATDSTGQYAKLRDDLIKIATTLRNRALRAPTS
ncbi:hypothetical protein [Kitasatospora sp. NPDC088134]|uniref:hypothetical protein n=1 Tax=Kitasatospora sp. NPDC088134 TaxID=3364071 RepID=UPI0038052822